MTSFYKVAVLGLVLAAPLAVTAEASAPLNHDTKAPRAPAATMDMATAPRYARARATMNDGWQGWDDEDRPRVMRRAKRPQVRRPVAQRPAARRYVAPRPGVQRQAHGHVARPAVRAHNGVERGYRAASVPRGTGDSGLASFYWQGQRTASGAAFNPNGLTAAHRTLPFGTRVRVTHMGNGRSVDVTINDRGPFIGGRIIDLSRGAASVIGMTGQGVANVRMQVIGR